MAGSTLAAILCCGAVLAGLLIVAVVLLMGRGSHDTAVADKQAEVPAVPPAAARPAVPVQPVAAPPVAAVSPPVVASAPPVAQGSPGPVPVDANGALPFQTLDALKRATVFVRVEAGNELASGSGFLARVDGHWGYVVTNHHVIAPERERIIVLQRPAPPRPPNSRLPPRPSRGGGTTIIVQTKGFENPTYTLVFNSGTAEEKSYPAEVAADDPNADLAILRMQNPPPGAALIAVDPQTPLVETMPVFVFGFPFGEMLSTNKGNPAITVGKASVSSIRKDSQGQLSVVQINGDLNPGNSGGPVVDPRGRLVGIAVASLKGTQIGLIIPAGKLPNVLTAAPPQGMMVLNRGQPAPLSDPPRPRDNQPIPAFPPPVAPPALVGKQPLTDAELGVLLQALASNNFALINNAMVSLAMAEPVDSQRERVILAVKPFATVSQLTADMYAARVLGIWGTKEVVPFLLETLKSKNVLARTEAIKSLGKLKDPRAAEALARRLAPIQHRMAASEALIAIGPEAEKTVLPYLKSEDVFVRHEVCKILEAIGTHKSVAPLRAALADSNGLVRLAAQNALTAVQERKKTPS